MLDAAACAYAFVAVIASTATACTLGRNYQRPSIQTPSTYRAASGQATPASLADLKWFELFHDDTLNGLIRTALQENFELRIAAQRVLQARAAYGITRAGQWPTVDASGDLIAARSSRVGAISGVPAGADTDVSYAQAGFSLGWELDVWGRLRRLNEAGVPAGVLLAPILPGITDSTASLEAVAEAAAGHNAAFLGTSTLRLAPVVKQEYLGFVDGAYPELLPRYERAYVGSNAPREYQQALDERVERIRSRFGFAEDSMRRHAIVRRTRRPGRGPYSRVLPRPGRRRGRRTRD